MSRRGLSMSLSREQQLVAWQSASLLLDYPDEGLLARLDLLREASHQLPAAVGEPLREVVVRLGSTPLPDLQADYVATFDTRRRCNLFLTYFAHGDTRKRGVALLRFKQAYLASGVDLEQAGGELPDHLCVVLEYAACVDPDQGRQLLLDHRAGLELLRMSLVEMRSPWAGVLQSVSATLPALRGDERDAVRRLAAEGPPEEEVGLTPYGTPQFDAALTDRGASVDLPMPTVRGA